MRDVDVKDLAEQVKALPVHQKLMLAAGLLEANKTPHHRRMALDIVESARLDLLAETLFGAATAANTHSTHAGTSPQTKEKPHE